MSDPKLSVLVRVDLGGRHLCLIVTGLLTGANQQGLHPVIRRARTLTPAAEGLVDLSAASPPEPAAAELIRAGIEQECRDRPGGTVEIVLSEPAAATDQTPQPVVARSGRADRAGRARRDSW
ncbi:hypothetical protein [Kocuria aegyptia]|uniref:Uncharacterized protein n=1 Tax=Kocuria aegyptia TaxID=330943 RepID=A0ABP4WHC5_9MICC